MIDVLGKELYSGNFIKTNFNVGLPLCINDAISFKLVTLKDMIKLYMFIPIWITLTIIQDHRIMRKPEDLHLFFRKVFSQSICPKRKKNLFFPLSKYVQVIFSETLYLWIYFA